MFKYKLENTEGVIKNGQSRETGNTDYTRRRETKPKNNAICVGHHYAQTNTNNVNKAVSSYDFGFIGEITGVSRRLQPPCR